ncbi:MAG TPA: hypothetical protein VF665_23935 [Longimicrobium sp.]|jgi:hypothetical protein|uniref:hypothetical protein n=1 Tax=Longimicrobium sp. TaxID=2029185 RepID=UPI002EDB1FF4
MKFAVLLLCACFASGCSVFNGRGPAGPDAPRSADQLWRQAHQALRQDSVRVAIAAFQRLANDHPRTREGREARFYLGSLYLNPDGSTFNATLAAQNLDIYVRADTAGGAVAHRPEAPLLLDLARQLVLPCEQRRGDLRCDPDPVVRTRVVGTDTVHVRASAEQTAETARLRRELAERDATIRSLREELQRIRNTLAPRPE